MPSARRRATTREPRKPPPPVTRTRTGASVTPGCYGPVKRGARSPVCFDRRVQQTAPRRWQKRSALRSGLLTGLAQVVVALAAAGAGALLAHKFGRNARTDGFLAAYAVYLVLVLAAQAFRMVVVPDLTRAAADGRLGGESRSYALAYLCLAVPVSILVALLRGPLAELLTGSLPPRAADIAST